MLGAVLGAAGLGAARAEPPEVAGTAPAAAAAPVAPEAAAAAAPEAAAPAPATGDAAAVTAPHDEVTHGVRRHYMWSNERRHDLFFGDLAGLGGGYVGVGGDQNYTLAGAARSDVLWLIDLDAAVVRMHRLYAALLPAAATPDEFLRFFDARRKGEVVDAIAAAYPGAGSAGERDAILSVYLAYRDDLRSHLRATQHYRWGGQRPTWLGDTEKYQHLRGLAQRGRIVPRLCDLGGPSAMLEIGDAARRAGVPMRTLYLSNAESWFRYGKEFRRNVGGLPFDDRGVVLRTVKSEVLAYAHGDIWHYSVQRATDFTGKLGRPEYKSIDSAMVDAAEALGRDKGKRQGLSRIGLGSGTAASETVAQTRSAREKRKELLASGLVTRPEGNREKARAMDAPRMKRAAMELAKVQSNPAP